MRAVFTFLFRLFLVIALVSCSKVPLTGRKQFAFMPESLVMQMSLTNYADFLKTHPPLPAQQASVQSVKTVGQRISGAVDKYMKENGYASRVQGYQWEFNAVDSKEVNAWCMPGGKVVVYTGLLPVSKDESGLAVVMGHEIAHAIAEHGNERMSQMLALYLGGISLELALQQQPQQTKNIFLTAYGMGSTLGELAYSRKHEYEADRLGLIFMAMAGYNPERALGFWQDMSKAGGAKPPEFLSTHPSDANRIKQLQKYLPEAKKYYKM
ncbi:MAG: M48 family metallopeptidase [Bacteroidetes bacterium]|nr:M48 family metallopeptidase [Bacteroidota bacterium]